MPVWFHIRENHEVSEDHPRFSPEEQAAAAALTRADLEAIDDTILAHAASGWLKVVCVVVHTGDALKGRYPSLSYLFYAHRVQHLAAKGHLESQGNLAHVRVSEVRLPR